MRSPAEFEPGELLTFDKEQLKPFLPNMRLSAYQPGLYDTLHTAETAGIELKEVLLVGVVGNNFDVGTELGRYGSRSMREALELVVEFIRRQGVKVERRAIALAMRPWWESENPAAS